MNKKIVAVFSTLIMACVSAIGCSLAWFYTPSSIVTDDVKGGLIKSYFHSGNGTSENPFIITRPVHLYNFIALQEELDAFSSQGFYFQFGTDLNDDGSPEFYKYKDDGSIVEGEYSTSLNMSYYSDGLDPMGTVAHPFQSIFNGNGLTISNLTIKGEGHMDVGIFGYVSTGTVTNLYFDSPTILTNGESTSAETADSTHVSHDETCCYNGYLVGHLKTASSFNNVYVNNCSLNGAPASGTIARNEYGYYGHVGDVAVTTKEKIKSMSGSSSGGDAGYNTSVNIRNLNDNLISYGQSDNGNGVIKAGVAIPFQEASDASFVTKSGTLTVGGKTVTNASTVSVSTTATNIGYYVGGTVASNVDTVAAMRVFKDHYTSETINYDDIQASTNSDVKTVPDRVKTYLQKTISGDVQQGYSVIRMGTPNTLSTTMTSDSGYYGIENGKVGSYSGNILVPNNCIWVAPIKAGTFEFVCTTENAKASYLYIWKLKRSTPKDYSTSLSTPDINNQATNFSSDSSAEVVGMQVYPASSPYMAYYYGTPITDDDINNGVEFAITMFGYQSMSPSIFITYIDVGSDGGGSSDGGSEATINEDDPLFTDVDYRDSGATVKNSILNIQYDAAAGTTSEFCIIVSYDSLKHLYTITITNSNPDGLEFSVLLNDDDRDSTTDFLYKYSIIYNSSTIVTESQVSKTYSTLPAVT